LETTNVTMKYLLSLIISGALVVSGFGQTRNVLVGTNNAVVQPTNFWSADASNARSGLGLGTAATNPASAFQPSSLVLSNLASSNAVNLTNLRATNVVGTLSLTQGGTGSTNAADARTAFGLGTAATNPASAFQPSSAVLSNLATSNGANLTNIQASNLVGTITTNLGIQFASITATNGESIFEDLSVLDEINAAQATFGTNTNIVIIGSSGISFGSSSVAATTRTNLGATTIGNALFTATNSSAAIDAIGISTNFSDQVLSVSNIQIGSFPLGSSYGFVTLQAGQRLQVDGTNVTTSVPAFYGFNGFESTAFSAATARTNLGLNAWTTNTNSPVFVGTNGEVVSPTNFWQVAPIVTRFVEFDPPTNATTNIVAARNLHIHSLAISRTGVTSTITLPTNGATFDGDIALVVHQGPTSSMTRVRTAGSTNDLVTMTRFDEAVEFVYYDNVWQFNHNRSFIEPIYFSGTNASANIAASRANLGLGWIALTNTQNTLYSGVATSILGFSQEITSGGTNLTGNNVLSYTNTNTLVVPANILIAGDAVPAPRTQKSVELNGTVTIRTPFSSPTTIYANNSITATDDSTYTNTLVAFGSNSVTFSNVTASGTLTATSTVTAKTNLVVEGFVDFSTNHTNVAPATNNQIQKFLQIRIGTNAFFLPLYK